MRIFILLHDVRSPSSLQVDPATVSFDEVGGLDAYIGALKEMVFLPLVYPQLFTRFSITPPRGVLFYGPPGTGRMIITDVIIPDHTNHTMYVHVQPGPGVLCQKHTCWQKHFVVYSLPSTSLFVEPMYTVPPCKTMQARR